MISFISLFEIVNIVTLHLNIFLLIAASVADTAAVDAIGLKTFLASGFSSFFLKCNPFLSHGHKKPT